MLAAHRGRDDGDNDDDGKGNTAAAATSEAIRYGVDTERRHAQVLSEVLGDGDNNGVSTDISFIEARAAGSGYSPEGFVVDSASGEDVGGAEGARRTLCGEERAQEGGKGFNQGQADQGPRNRCAVGEFFPTASLNLF